MIRCWPVRSIVHHAAKRNGYTRFTIRRHARRVSAIAGVKAPAAVTIVCVATGGVLWMQPKPESEVMPAASGIHATTSFDIAGPGIGVVADERHMGGSAPWSNVSAAPAVEPVPVPEPSTLALFGAALVGVLVVRR